MPSPQQSASLSEAEAHTFREQPSVPRRMLRKAYSRLASFSGSPDGITKERRVSKALGGCMTSSTSNCSTSSRVTACHGDATLAGHAHNEHMTVSVIICETIL
eukprot:6214746-Pleurochrysis_carterae.AAC.1